MSSYKSILLFLLFFVGGYLTSDAQLSCPPNIDFEQGNTANWNYYRGTVATGPVYTLTSSPATPGWHTLMSGAGNDPYGGFPVVGSGSYSLKLGHDTTNYCAERARYYIHVPPGPSGYSLIYRYAVVFQDPGSSHSAAQKPRFEVNAYDSTTGTPISCAQYTYVAGSSLPGFVASTVDPTALYKTWSIASMNLSALSGTTITMDFTAADCTQGGHWGYGYLDMSCGLFSITSVICGSPMATLTAPVGFGVYAWYDSATFGTFYGSTQTISFPTPSAPFTIAVILQPYAGFGCPDTLYTRVIPSNLTLHGSNDTTICFGSAITLSSGATSIAMPLRYNWTPATGLSCTTCANPIASPTVNTVYMVSVVDGAGCSRIDTISVFVNVPPLVVGSGAATLCIGSSASLSASGGLSYIWSPPTGLSCTSCSGPVATPAATVLYTVTGFNSAGCSDMDTVRVTVMPHPTVAVPGITICNGTGGALAATGAASYSWSPAIGLSCTFCTGPIASPPSTTTYTIIGTSGICADTATTTVTVNPLPIVDAGSPVSLCQGANTVLSPTGGVSYTWSPGAGLSCTGCTNPVASPTVTTVYTVIGTDANGCRNTDIVTITVNPLPIIVAGAPVSLCPGATTTLFPSGGLSYSWFPTTGLTCSICTNPLAYPTLTTLYTVTGTDANGCRNTDTIRVTRVMPFTVSATNITICNGSPGALLASGASTYVWSPGTGLSCTTCSGPIASPAATTTYTIIGAVAACFDTTTVTVTVNPLPAVTAGGGAPRCIGDTCTIIAGGGLSYSWTPATGLSCVTCPSPVASPVVTTAYTVTAVNAFGCTAPASTTVVINPLPIITAPPVDLCFGFSTTLTASGAATYKWSPATGLSTTLGASVAASPSVTTTYKIIGIDANNCKDSALETVTVIPIPPDPAVVSPVNYCMNAPAIPLSATGIDLLWYSPGSAVGSSTIPVPSTAAVGTTTYYVSQTVGGCESARLPILVNVAANAETDFDFDIKYGCYVDTVSFVNRSSFVHKYLWSFGDYQQDSNFNPIHYYPVVLQPTDFIVTLYGYSEGCYNDSTIKTLTIQPSPRGLFLTNVTPDQTIPFGSSVQLNADNAYIYTWKPENGTLNNTNIKDPVATPTEDITYIVYGRNLIGCMDSAEVNITLAYPDDIVIPDAFSPNGDGLNDIFKVINIHSGKLRDFKIFNRWGELVFETNNIEVGWDGTFHKIPQDMNVFKYLVIVEHTNRVTTIYKGDVTLVR